VLAPAKARPSKPRRVRVRVCARLAEREGFTVTCAFSDPAISGGTARRPEYQRMLEAARRGEFDVIVAEHTSRLWRELSELWRALKELTDRGIDVVTQDVDTRRTGSMWARKAVGLNAKRRSKWVASTIHGQLSRGIGILNNERYIGWVAWGCSAGSAVPPIVQNGT
jgi:Resolvase, N terminal domain